MVSEFTVKKTTPQQKNREALRVLHPNINCLPVYSHPSYATLFPSPNTSASDVDGQANIYNLITEKGSSCQFQELALLRQKDLPVHKLQ